MDPTNYSFAKTPKFLRTLYTILHSEPTHILAWAPCGSHFQVFDVHALETRVLPRYFKHNKFASFQRQLNNFGFRKWTKTRASVCTFSHESLRQCLPSELPTMVQAMQTPEETVASSCGSTSHKRQRSDCETTETWKKTKNELLIVSEDESEDVWSLDWHVFYGEDMHSVVDDDTVGLPLELLFPDEKELDVLEPLAVDDVFYVEAYEWRLLAECLE